jgi:hypothetical protein
LQAADGLRKDAEHARLNLAEAEQDVAAARALLAEAEAQERRARAEVDGIAHDIAWCEQQAARRQPPAYDPAAQHREVGLMREEPAHDEPDTPVATPDDDRDDLPFNVVQAPAEVVAALTGGHPAPGDPLVAAHGPDQTGPLDPTVTTPDAGLAHPVPNPPGPSEARHAKPRPRGSRLTGPFRALGLIADTDQHDEQGDHR